MMLADSRFDPDILSADHGRRPLILPVLDAALDAVDPAQAVRRALRRQGNQLLVAETTYTLDSFQRAYVIGFGKAATPMARAVAEVVGPRLDKSVLVTKYGHGPQVGELPFPVSVLEAGHPVPDDAGLEAAKRIADLARQATADDLVLCLISGGGSALLTLPAEGLTLKDLQETTAALLRCGATINEINTLRKHLSQVKGGQLARLAAPATLVSLVVSDVVGSPLEVIASGPTVPDPTSWSDAWAVVECHKLAQVLPMPVIARLQHGLAGEIHDTPKQDDPCFERCQAVVIADNAQAAKAALAKAQELGFQAAVLSTYVEGEARELGKVAVALGREMVAHGRPLAPPACLILGGETTVTLRGTGKGGRNQELALAAAVKLHEIPEGEGIVVAALATDGSDGPTDAAGGLADSTTVSRGHRLGLEATQHLANNDAYPFLQAVGDLLVTGPTHTNVNDLLFVFVF